VTLARGRHSPCGRRCIKPPANDTHGGTRWRGALRTSIRETCPLSLRSHKGSRLPTAKGFPDSTTRVCRIYKGKPNGRDSSSSPHRCFQG
jgi:hypothetical protein